MYCKKCGEKIKKEDKFCIKCGTNQEEFDIEKAVKEEPKAIIKEKRKKKPVLLIIFLILFILATIVESVLLVMKNNEVSKKQKEINNYSEDNSSCVSKLNSCTKDKEALSKKNEELSQEEYQEKLKKEIKELEDKKASLQSTVDSLNKGIINSKGAPKTYPAGYLYVGTDIPAGRYKISNGKSNFIVHSSTGSLMVNIILGGNYGVDEYIYNLNTE